MGFLCTFYVPEGAEGLSVADLQLTQHPNPMDAHWGNGGLQVGVGIVDGGRVEQHQVGVKALPDQAPVPKMDEISSRLGMEVGEAVLHILQHEGPEVIAIYFSISEEDVIYVMKTDIHCVCTDGIVGAHPHPRAYASFPRFLGHYVRDEQVMPLQEAIRHITSEPRFSQAGS